MDRAPRLTDPGSIRIAPAEIGGERMKLRGLPDIMANAERQTAHLEIHAVTADGPFVGSDRFAIRSTFDQIECFTTAIPFHVSVIGGSIKCGR